MTQSLGTLSQSLTLALVILKLRTDDRVEVSVDGGCLWFGGMGRITTLAVDASADSGIASVSPSDPRNQGKWR